MKNDFGLKKKTFGKAILVGILLSISIHLLTFVLFQLSTPSPDEESHIPMEVDFVEIPEFDWSKPPDPGYNINEHLSRIIGEKFISYSPNAEIDYPMPRILNRLSGIQNDDTLYYSPPENIVRNKVLASSYSVFPLLNYSYKSYKTIPSNEIIPEEIPESPEWKNLKPERAVVGIHPEILGITGEISLHNRKVLSYNLPKSPSGLDYDTEITLGFTLLPDGTTSRIIPILRDGSILEKLCIEALREWQFSMVPGNEELSGEIVFKFQAN